MLEYECPLLTFLCFGERRPGVIITYAPICYECFSLSRTTVRLTCHAKDSACLNNRVTYDRYMDDASTGRFALKESETHDENIIGSNNHELSPFSVCQSSNLPFHHHYNFIRLHAIQKRQNAVFQTCLR
jgi:hypothetical protein